MRAIRPTGTARRRSDETRAADPFATADVVAAACDRAAKQPGAWAFAILYAVESFSRATLASIVPIQAYDLLKDEQKVSILYFLVGMAGLVGPPCAPGFFPP